MATFNNIIADYYVTPKGISIPKAKPLIFKQRKEIYKRDKGICQICASSVKLFCSGEPPHKRGEIDHIFPRSRGGQNKIENLQLVCALCNRRKSNNG